MNHNRTKNKLKLAFLLSLTLAFSISYTKSLENYLDNYPQDTSIKIERCKKSECSCLNPTTNIIFECPNTEANLCFASGECRMQKNGFCGFTFSKSLRQCLTKANYCKIGGWYNERCVKTESKSFQGPNIPRPENICYKDAICEVQLSGDCGWTETPKFKKCFRKFSFI